MESIGEIHGHTRNDQKVKIIVQIKLEKIGRIFSLLICHQVKNQCVVAYELEIFDRLPDLGSLYVSR